MENSSDLQLRRESEVYHHEFSNNSAWDLVTTTSWGSHGTDELNVFYFLEDLVLDSIEPASVVHPLSEKFEGRLRAICILFGHVQIINIYDHFLTVWYHFSFCSSHHFSLNHILCFYWARLRWKDDVGDFPVTLVKFSQNLVDKHSFSCSCNSNAQRMQFAGNTGLYDIFGPGGVNSWY